MRMYEVQWEVQIVIEMMEDNCEADGYPSNKTTTIFVGSLHGHNCTNVKHGIDCVNHPSTMNK